MRKMLNKHKFIFLIIIILLIVFCFLIYIAIITPKQEKGIKELIIEENQVVEAKSDLFEEYYDEAKELLKNMTLEEKVGQMFLVRYPQSSVVSEIKNENPGGYILFSRDFDNKTKDTMIEELKNCQTNSKIKLILAVDEEGGSVVRVSNHKQFRNMPFESPQEIWKSGGLEAILNDSNEKSELLKSIGLNMNLAPVVDIPTNSSSFIYKRSYGKSAEETAEYTKALIQTMNSDGMISVMKHFPGYGDNVDTHTGIAIDTREYSVFETADLLPFKSGIQVGAPAILVNHNIVNCIDESRPASLSEPVHKILREDLNFTGIIMTDDLAMGAVEKYATDGKIVVQAVLAGNDMIISSDLKSQKQEVVNAVKNGEIEEQMIDDAVTRILAMKYVYSIL